MAWLIGTDEAGYGPRLGPLVIGATLWQVADTQTDLYTALAGCVRAVPVDHDDVRQLAIADSKRLYTAGGSLQQLERAVHASLELVHTPARSWRTIWQVLVPQSLRWIDRRPWYQQFDCPLPIDARPSVIVQLANRLQVELHSARIRLVSLRARGVDPGEFNRRVRQLQSKGTLLSLSTLRLVRQMIERCDHQPICVLCDKHGGRSYYAGLLQQCFEGQLVQVIREHARISVYRLSWRGRSVEFRFEVGGEKALPSALASMLAKYLRELAMRAFNAYWLSHDPQLQPTAGYPADAERFQQAIQPIQARLAIPNHILWRER